MPRSPPQPVTVKCEVRDIEITMDPEELSCSVQAAIERQLGFVVSKAIEERIKELTRLAMEPHLPQIEARIKLQLEGELDRIIVGRKV